MKREELLSQIFQTMGTMKRTMHGRVHHLVPHLDISRSQLEILMAIHHMQPISAAELAKHLSLTPGAVSQLVDSLIRLDMLSRTPDPADRRTQILKLSANGVSQVQKIEKHRHEVMKHILDELDTDELSTLLRIQQKIIATLQNQPQKTKETKD